MLFLCLFEKNRLWNYDISFRYIDRYKLSIQIITVYCLLLPSPGRDRWIIFYYFKAFPLISNTCHQFTKLFPLFIYLFSRLHNQFPRISNQYRRFTYSYLRLINFFRRISKTLLRFTNLFSSLNNLQILTGITAEEYLLSTTNVAF